MRQAVEYFSKVNVHKHGSNLHACGQIVLTHGCTCHLQILLQVVCDMELLTSVCGGFVMNPLATFFYCTPLPRQLTQVCSRHLHNSDLILSSAATHMLWQAIVAAGCT